MSGRLSVVVPALGEAAVIGAALRALAPLRAAGEEVIVVDGGSADGTAEAARGLADRVLVCRPPGRARQMNAGAAVARGTILWFLHADTLPAPGAAEAIRAAVAAGAGWGRFDVRLSGAHPLLRVVERAMNLRSRLTGIATGDQGIFVRRDWFEAAGGFPDIPLMEDIALSRALRRRGRPACLAGPLVTSSRRWEAHGVVRTILLMWRLRLAYFLGADPARLARRYARP
ncbi:TIGR04283 family arsenosugar biosynthesis glycosyltransferase [Inmirania thermothiophila]|uniref:RSAM/selenodomain-associated transferase 2 n=1 Tax=Inmirania thermothiophila TaxID=1750597 RepID=A0A3N1Y821_9GAMM|nr:TIGR04283 family arsenosugar biosynthesis glycosyltransferase [Inmirania thermothiophila]ROR34900.1 rSAM/selenodomain-associated transferase 2 [Inmirania thermothiophila]